MFVPNRHNRVQLTALVNAHLERFHGSIKAECLDRLILFGETMLRNAIREYLVHYHGERNHQGLGNRLIEPGDEVAGTVGTIQRRERLGGLLKYYYRDAAGGAPPCSAG